MFSPATPISEPASPLDPLDRAAIGYVVLPLFIFLAGWLEWWAALPLIACSAYALKSLIGNWRAAGGRPPVTRLQLGVAVAVGCAWTICGGTDHLVFANADWHIRDAVLHDLVSSPWPVGYGLLDGKETLLRASVGYFLPAALIGKGLGLSAAHTAMALWTGLGATLFLLQVVSLAPSGIRAALAVTAVVVLFSGLDIVGNLLNDGPHFRSDWNVTTHLEWWAGNYQYSSMTTQLFWVPNHALAAWLVIGLLYRNVALEPLGAVLPILVVAAALWSPLSAVGLVPFVLWKVGAGMLRSRSLNLLHPKIWAPALAVGVVVAGYLELDPGHIPKGLAVAGGSVGAMAMALSQQAQFFLLEAGFIGFAILWIRRTHEVMIALLMLALLPFAYFGPANDLVMRASIPSLAVLAIGAALALVDNTADSRSLRKHVFLGGLLAVGAATASAEFARAFILPAWPINMRATLIGANCGKFPPHYVARLGGEAISRLLQHPHPIDLGPQGREACDNPALDLMWGGSPL
jgi:hypothetical protein